MIEPSIILAFVGGLLTVTTPCVISILPIVFAGSLGHKLKPILIILGQITSFTLMGSLFSMIGLLAVGFKEVLRIIFIFIIISFGLIMSSKKINGIYARFSFKLLNYFSGLFRKEVASNLYQGTERSSLWGAFVLGLSLGVVWTPCAGPILGSILTYASYMGNLIFGSFLLLIYSIGIALPILSIAYAGKFILNQMGWIVRNSKTIEKIAGVALIIIGVLMLFGWDQYLQAILIPYFPELETDVIKSGII